MQPPIPIIPALGVAVSGKALGGELGAALCDGGAGSIDGEGLDDWG